MEENLKRLSDFFAGAKETIVKIAEEFCASFSNAPKVRAHITVKGRIFEGSYHVFVEQKARTSGLKGWMKVRDGLSASAYIELEIDGTEPKVKTFLTDLRTGTRDSNVALVTVQWKTAGKPAYNTFQRLL